MQRILFSGSILQTLPILFRALHRGTASITSFSSVSFNTQRCAVIPVHLRHLCSALTMPFSLCCRKPSHITRAAGFRENIGGGQLEFSYPQSVSKLYTANTRSTSRFNTLQVFRICVLLLILFLLVVTTYCLYAPSWQVLGLQYCWYSQRIRKVPGIEVRRGYSFLDAFYGRDNISSKRRKRNMAFTQSGVTRRHWVSGRN